MLSVRHKINPDGTIMVKVGRETTTLRSSADITAFTTGFKVGVIAARRAMTESLDGFDTVIAEFYPVDDLGDTPPTQGN